MSEQSTQLPRGPQPGWLPQALPTNGLAIASLVLGILWLYGVGSVLALVLGYVARGQMRADPRQQGAGLATAGIVLGWIGIGGLILSLLFFVPTSVTLETGLGS